MKYNRLENKSPKEGDLQVWHIPQIPGKPFLVSVSSILEAKLLLNVLVEYDLFQYENNIKPDYSNSNGLEVFNGEWLEWEDDMGYRIEEYEVKDGKLFVG